jgi:lipoyl(octanoyl) transferase
MLPRTDWRLVLTPPAPGAWNMAVDEAILEAVGRGEARPTLRLYAWAPPCLSLGYAQPVSDISTEAVQTHGWQVVRRLTGGRAILHTDEITYSVCGPLDEPRLAGGVLESYRRLAGALLRALELLGVPAKALEKPQSAPPAEAGPLNPVCFEVPSNYEITAGGRKLLGSAQARRKEGVLQHGSLPLVGDLRRILQALNFPDPQARWLAAERLLERAVTTEGASGRVIDWDEAAQAFQKGFTETLNLELRPAELSAAELARAEVLMKEKYDSWAWTGRL